jgi:hypothetical protein
MVGGRGWWCGCLGGGGGWWHGRPRMACVRGHHDHRMHVVRGPRTTAASDSRSHVFRARMTSSREALPRLRVWSSTLVTLSNSRGAWHQQEKQKMGGGGNTV